MDYPKQANNCTCKLIKCFTTTELLSFPYWLSIISQILATIARYLNWKLYLMNNFKHSLDMTIINVVGLHFIGTRYTCYNSSLCIKGQIRHQVPTKESFLPIRNDYELSLFGIEWWLTSGLPFWVTILSSLTYAH